MRNGGGNRSTRRKPAPVPLCAPKIPHYFTEGRNRAAVEKKDKIQVKAKRNWTKKEKWKR
jgi:hypothetical protein